MENKLTWQQIETQFNHQWVQLVDYDWPEGTPYPKSGVVRVHAPERKEFYQKVHAMQPKPADSAFVFVGIPQKMAGETYTNFHKIIS